MSDDADPQINAEADSPERISLGAVADIPVLYACIARLARPGFSSPPRIIFALAAPEIPILASSTRLLEEVQIALPPLASASVPRSLGTLWLSEEVSVDLIALPLAEAFAPLWTLVLPGAAAVVRLTSDAGISATLLKAHCEELSIKLINAAAIVRSFDIASPFEVAAFLDAVIRAAAAP